MTRVWPALWPPWNRTTTSACSDSQSTILPLPSSPHWAPTTTTFAIASSLTRKNPGARPGLGKNLANPHGGSRAGGQGGMGLVPGIIPRPEKNGTCFSAPARYPEEHAAGRRRNQEGFAENVGFASSWGLLRDRSWGNERVCWDAGQHLRAGAFRLQPEGLLEGWRERRSGSMLYDDEEPEAALAHGSFRRTGDANPPIVSSGGAPWRKPGLGLRAGPAHSLGLLRQGLRDPAQDRTLLPQPATPRERAPRGTRLHTI